MRRKSTLKKEAKGKLLAISKTGEVKGVIQSGLGPLQDNRNVEAFLNDLLTQSDNIDDFLK